MSSIENFTPGFFYHVFNRGNNKENIFVEEKNYAYFLQKVAYYLTPICKVFAYCLMPNHFHFVLQIKPEEELPKEYVNGTKKLHQPFSNLFNSYTKAINKAYNRTGSLFQEHLHRKRIDENNYLMDVILYVHLNPNKHGFGNYANYKYSSFNAINSTKSTGVKREMVLELFDDNNNFLYCHKEQLYKNEQRLIEIEEEDYI